MVLICAARFSFADGGDSFPEDAPAYNAIVARSFLIEVEPLVEKYTGWDCEWPVPFRLVTRAEYVDQSMAEAKKLLQQLAPEMDSKQIEGGLRFTFASQALGLLGRFSTVSHQIYLLPGNLKPILRDLGVEQRFTRDMVEVVLAHELTHSVQDARFKITDRALKMESDDERTAWTMIIEGHASWVQERVADDLGLSESAHRFATQMLEKHRALGLDSKSSEMANVRGYLQGKTFVEAVFAKGGTKAVQQLFVDPPKSPRLIENPSEFLLHVAAK